MAGTKRIMWEHHAVVVEGRRKVSSSALIESWAVESGWLSTEVGTGAGPDDNWTGLLARVGCRGVKKKRKMEFRISTTGFHCGFV